MLYLDILSMIFVMRSKCCEKNHATTARKAFRYAEKHVSNYSNLRIAAVQTIVRWKISIVSQPCYAVSATKADRVAYSESFGAAIIDRYVEARWNGCRQVFHENIKAVDRKKFEASAEANCLFHCISTGFQKMTRSIGDCCRGTS